MPAVRKDAADGWQAIPHGVDSLDQAVALATLSETLTDHPFQEAQPPGLYPEQPTACGCGATPPQRPDEGDWAWWTVHVLTEAATR